MADCLEKLEQIGDAALADEEAMTILSPYFVAAPSAFSDLMQLIVSDYVRRSDKARHQKDMDLLRPILEALKQSNETD